MTIMVEIIMKPMLHQIFHLTFRDLLVKSTMKVIIQDLLQTTSIR